MSNSYSGRIAGYCKLCRAEEIRVYGTVLCVPDDRHERACYDAGCKHPPHYYKEELPSERFAEIERDVTEKLGDDEGPQDDY